MRERGVSRSSPPATGRATSVPDTAVVGDPRSTTWGATGTPIVTPPTTAPAAIAGQGPFLLVWLVKDSNLGRHQLTDLQLVSVRHCGGAGSQ
jgi:hypothetical protein